MPIDRKNMILWNKALLLSEHVVEVTVSMAKGSYIAFALFR